MVKSNDIVVQAEQGSVAAIIQVLNQQLSTSGIRVRAVLVRGVLQLLCEAGDAARLERQHLVQHIRQILESLRPRHIRRVRINSRIVNEQQLLWLDEISRDADSQLLWSEDIILSRQNPITQIVKTWQDSPKESAILPASTARQQREKRQFQRGLWGGALLAIGLLLVGWLVYGWLRQTALVSTGQGLGESSSLEQSAAEQSPAEQPSGESAGEAPRRSVALNSVSETDWAGDDTDAQPQTPPEAINSAAAETPADPFADAVRLAEQAAIAGQTASTRAEWLELADQWQRASQLMGQVLPDDDRHITAQDRYQLYQEYEATARSQAQ